MKNRWQMWFLVTFLICGSWCIWDNMTAYSRGEKAAEANWRYAQSKHFESLAAYCAALPISGNARTPQLIRHEIFDPQNNPLICSPTLPEAKAAYVLLNRDVAKNKSIQVTLTFIGAWIFLYLAATLLQKWIRRRKQATAEVPG